LSVKSSECKSSDAKLNAKSAKVLATARLLLRPLSRKNALHPITYLWMCQPTPGIHQLAIFKLRVPAGSLHVFKPMVPIFRFPDHLYLSLK